MKLTTAREAGDSLSQFKGCRPLRGLTTILRVPLLEGFLIRTRLKQVLLFALLATGCNRLFEERQVKHDFLKAHPSYTIISVGDADGNDTTIVTFFIRYKKPNDEREYWSDWAYETKNGKLELVGEGRENLFSERRH